jgi:hypothetical protein
MSRPDAASFEVEARNRRDRVLKLVYTSDLYLEREHEPIRVEVMWRSRTGRADIANYVLGKFGNYGRAIGLLS